MMHKYYVKVTDLAGVTSKEFNFKAHDYEHLKEKTLAHLAKHEKNWYKKYGPDFKLQMEWLR